MNPSDSSLTYAAVIIICVVGPLHLACIFGTILCRNIPAFAARGLKISLGPLLFKAFGFALVAWLFLEADCPCIVAVAMLWVDWTANYWNVLKKVSLLWRYEIQAALDHNKKEGGVRTAILDENNIYLRYRQILRPRGQNILMGTTFAYVSAYSVIALAVFNHLALEPCLTDRLLDNELALVIIILSFGAFVPMLVVSFWGTIRLRRFLNDNWGMYRESRIITAFTASTALATIFILSFIPTFDGIIFFHLAGSIAGSALHFLLPLRIHFKTLSQLAKLRMNNISSFDELLQSQAFVDAFATFLRAEFSSEHLFFWLEVKRLKHDFGFLLPSDRRPAGFLDREVRDPQELAQLLTQAAKECRNLGGNCIGVSAPWQINISGEAELKLELKLGAAMQKLSELLQSGSTAGLEAAVEETLEGLGLCQVEVFELLRKDPYPRFLLTNSAERLNGDENFKRMLASEKLENEVEKHTKDTKDLGKRSRGSTGSSKGSSEGKVQRTKSTKGSGNDRKSPSLLLPPLQIEISQRPSIARSDNTVSESEFIIEMPSPPSTPTRTS